MITYIPDCATIGEQGEHEYQPIVWIDGRMRVLDHLQCNSDDREAWREALTWAVEEVERLNARAGGQAVVIPVLNIRDRDKLHSGQRDTWYDD